MLVELEEVEEWLKEHVHEYLVDDWNAPLEYDEGKEIAKAIFCYFKMKKIADLSLQMAYMTSEPW